MREARRTSAEGGSLCRGTCNSADPQVYLRQDCALGLELCALLEDVADSLPHEFSPTQAATARRALLSYLPAHIDMAEGILFPLIRKRLPHGDPLNNVLEQLDQEHAHSRGSLIELIEVLAPTAAERPPDNAEAFAYLLRCFFEAQRRHIAWEREVLLPPLNELLLAQEVEELKLWIQKSGGHTCANKQIAEIRNARTRREDQSVFPRHLHPRSS